MIMDEALKQDIKNAIKRSGFPLEHKVCKILHEHGWQTISNRYYIDDIKGAEREIDIVAYKLDLDETENIEYITTLIISCKKNDKNKWCFLTKKTDPTDANFNWTPLHYCTTDERLDYMTKRHKGFLIRKYKAHNAISHLYDFTENVFAYEKLREPNNDNERDQKGNIIINGNQDIYESIITTIKALEFEKGSRIERYGNYHHKRYYTFHPISIFDGEMVKVLFNEDGTLDINKIVEIKYLNRHIINNVDDFYIVNFIQKDNFEFRLNLFDYIHQINSRTLPKLVNAFYEDIFKYSDRVAMYWDDFSQELAETIQTYADSRTNPLYITDPLPILLYTYKDNKLIFLVKGELYEDDELLEKLNKNEQFMDEVREILNRYYRYEGQVIFTNY